jgi:hypothetical protein
MKKLLPVILFVVGIAFVGVIYFMFGRSTKKTEVVEEEDNVVAEIALADRPVTSLTPTKDGHWLVLKIENIKVKATSMDYELLYKVGDGRTQGVPGNIKLSGESRIERKLLLGSESSGKFRYDEGVEEGTISLRFRNDKGKLIGKLTTNFHLQSGDTELSTIDGKFVYTLKKAAKGTYFVTMETFGMPVTAQGSVNNGPYGVFASDDSNYAGKTNLSGKVLRYNGTDWESADSSANSVGIFISASE